MRPFFTTLLSRPARPATPARQSAKAQGFRPAHSRQQCVHRTFSGEWIVRKRRIADSYPARSGGAREVSYRARAATQLHELESVSPIDRVSGRRQRGRPTSTRSPITIGHVPHDQRALWQYGGVPPAVLGAFHQKSFIGGEARCARRHTADLNRQAIGLYPSRA